MPSLPRPRTAGRSPLLLAVVAAALALATVAALTLRPAPAPAAPVAAAAPAPGQLTPFLRFIGTGTVTAKPDQATLEFSTDGRGGSQSQAMNQASARMRRLIDALKLAGVADADLRSGGGYAARDWQDSSRWTATQSLTVTVRDLGRAGNLLALGTDNGATSSSGPSFSLSDTSASYQAALRRAVQDARAKAEAAAALMGVRIAGVVSVDEGGAGQPYPVGDTAGMARSAAATSPPPVQPGTQQVAATVMIVFSYRR
jgi:uncharacterized protein